MIGSWPSRAVFVEQVEQDAEQRLNLCSVKLALFVAQDEQVAASDDLADLSPRWAKLLRVGKGLVGPQDLGQSASEHRQRRGAERRMTDTSTPKQDV